MLLKNRKLTLLTTAMFLFAFQRFFSQDLSEELVTEMYKAPLIYASYNKREKVVEFYENEVIKYKMAIDWDDLKSWTIDVKLQKQYFFGGKIKSTGPFVIVSVPGTTWISPVGRHVLYRRNGKTKKITHYSESGAHLSDSLFHKDGRFKKFNIPTYKE